VCLPSFFSTFSSLFDCASGQMMSFGCFLPQFVRGFFTNKGDYRAASIDYDIRFISHSLRVVLFLLTLWPAGSVFVMPLAIIGAMWGVIVMRIFPLWLKCLQLALTMLLTVVFGLRQVHCLAVFFIASLRCLSCEMRRRQLWDCARRAWPRPRRLRCARWPPPRVCLASLARRP
jgi:hypothetical protein